MRGALIDNKRIQILGPKSAKFDGFDYTITEEIWETIKNKPPDIIITALEILKQFNGNIV